MTGSSSKTLR